MSRKNLVSVILFFSAALFIYPQTVLIRAGGGIMRLQDDSFRKVYGTAFPLTIEAGVGMTKNFGLAVGLDWTSKKGQALALDQGEDRFPVHFEMISIPVSVYYQYAGKLGSIPVGLAFGLGASWHSYKENWETADLTYQGKKWGPLVYTTVDFRLFSRVGVFTSLRWESISTGQASPLDDNVNLGGIKLLAGITLFLR
jgi:hypothetical protein